MPDNTKAFEAVVPETCATVMRSALAEPDVEIVAICIVVDPEVFPETVIVSVVPALKSTSMLMVPPPVRFPVTVNASSATLSCKDNVPAKASSPVVRDCVPRNVTVAPVCTDTFSQLVRLVAVSAWAPEANCRSSTDCVAPVSVPPSKVAEEVRVPPENVNVSCPAPS